MPKVRMLPGEQEEARLRPHPLSFAGRYLVAALPALWGAALFFILRTDAWASAEQGKWYQVWTFLYGNAPAAYVYAILGVGVLGAAVAVLRIRWSVFFWFLAVGGTAVTVTAGWFGDRHEWVLPALLWASAGPALLWVELDRRSHRYILTNLRILFRGGWIVHRERQLRFEAITDLDGAQGPLGRIFRYGTLIPVTQSGFGLGADTSQAFIGMAVGGNAGAKGLGAGAGIGAAAGGGREVQVGRARSYHQLTGVHPYKKVKFLLESLVQNATATPYLRQQVELQQAMLDALQHHAPFVERRAPPS